MVVSVISYKKTMRKYSDKFINDTIGCIDVMNERVQSETPLLPEIQSKFDSDVVNKVVKHRSDTSYVKGFWLGYSLALGIKDECK